ncbi:uncharacterized protein LOC120184555 [Hibiscus syriacus]|uniref:uncharacterized protein LOC120184555 n=1 Tax=Hibiscus syriacus TaxID=106335 RepID=UPI001924BFF8|nr:uncharacterized protein LOC120184555 [Hibiscus syriacus]XP_039044925.1 uncharacterized protein LOC120184555 [Hibiscus syriacus]
MDAFNVKFENRNAKLKHRHLNKVASLLRFVEFCVVLVLISRFTVQLPVAVKSSGEYFRGLPVVLVSPRFVFIVGNVIVITLLSKAGQFSPRGPTSGTDLYEEFVEKSEKNQMIHRYEIEFMEKQRKKNVECVDQEKRSSLHVHTTASKGTIKSYRRTQSENLNRKKCKQLRKSGSEKHIKHGGSGEKTVKSLYPEDGLSSEQFRNTVEAFIARKKALLREEEEEHSVICKDFE